MLIPEHDNTDELANACDTVLHNLHPKRTDLDFPEECRNLYRCWRAIAKVVKKDGTDAQQISRVAIVQATAWNEITPDTTVRDFFEHTLHYVARQGGVSAREFMSIASLYYTYALSHVQQPKMTLRTAVESVVSESGLQLGEDTVDRIVDDLEHRWTVETTRYGYKDVLPDHEAVALIKKLLAITLFRLTDELIQKTMTIENDLVLTG